VRNSNLDVLGSETLPSDTTISENLFMGLDINGTLVFVRRMDTTLVRNRVSALVCNALVKIEQGVSSLGQNDIAVPTEDTECDGVVLNNVDDPFDIHDNNIYFAPPGPSPNALLVDICCSNDYPPGLIIDGQMNWWGSNDENEIEDWIHHFVDDIFLPLIDFVPFRDSPLQIVGDSDGDGDIDFVDFHQFQLCFTGEGSEAVQSPFPCTFAFDFDLDSDVDLSDLDDFQQRFTGPGGL
jgi:hypothetical protein